jgi:hypothetical protein
MEILLASMFVYLPRADVVFSIYFWPVGIHLRIDPTADSGCLVFGGWRLFPPESAGGIAQSISADLFPQLVALIKSQNKSPTSYLLLTTCHLPPATHDVLCFNGGFQGLIGCHHRDRRGIVSWCLSFLPLTYLISMIKLVPGQITSQSTYHVNGLVRHEFLILTEHAISTSIGQLNPSYCLLNAIKSS